MPIADVVLALLRCGAAHGYTLKHRHDGWFPDARPLAFGHVYATLARLERDGLVAVAGTSAAAGPERTVYALTPVGAARLGGWLEEPVEEGGSNELVRKTVAALRTGDDPSGFLARQRTAHLRRIRELNATPLADPRARLGRDHVVAHLDADLRWLDLAVERVAAAR